jgi:hypothetical protein
MEESLKRNAVYQVETYKQNSARLELEGFKIESVFNLMNNCSDRCNLQYKESGLKDKSSEDVECFRNCLTKSHKVDKLLFE